MTLRAPNWNREAPAIKVDVDALSWLHPDGCRTPYGGPAYPACQHGSRATMLDDPQQLADYVGTPAERLERAQAKYEEAYGAWSTYLRWLRGALDEEPSEDPLIAKWQERQAASSWGALVGLERSLKHSAADLDRVEQEVAECHQKDDSLLGRLRRLGGGG